ncbi:MAG: endonuclease/exonuclease/phosphatase family protein [Bdellovibrionaceae bacterium]|nr:endonuclease/exonuclease/phosphatase family protein [Pseudobdellovibrionaceae bacterium]
MGGLEDLRLRVAEFNVENLFLLLDHYQGQDLSRLSEDQWQSLTISTTGNKPLEQVRALAKVFHEIDADIFMLCEVGGRESLENFNRHFLDDRYKVHLIEGNSDRGIDLGYLVKKSLPFKYDLISHKHRSIDFLYPHERQTQETGYTDRPSGRINSHRFSRDVLELRLFEEGAVQPALVVMLVHLKSQLDRDRIDPSGRDRRKAELEKLMKIYSEIESDLGGQTPILIAGDFNGLAQKQKPDPEFEAIYRDTSLMDVLEIAQVPLADRYTFMQIGRNSSQSRQLDYIFVSPQLQGRIVKNETFVYRYKDEWGFVAPPPRNLNEKKLLPSDHYPVVLTLEGLTASSGSEDASVDESSSTPSR